PPPDAAVVRGGGRADYRLDVRQVAEGPEPRAAAPGDATGRGWPRPVRGAARCDVRVRRGGASRPLDRRGHRSGARAPLRRPGSRRRTVGRRPRRRSQAGAEARGPPLRPDSRGELGSPEAGRRLLGWPAVTKLARRTELAGGDDESRAVPRTVRFA